MCIHMHALGLHAACMRKQASKVHARACIMHPFLSAEREGFGAGVLCLVEINKAIFILS